MTTAHKLSHIAKIIDSYRPLWEQRPFVELPVAWENKWTELSLLLRGIAEDQLENIEADPVGFLDTSGVAKGLASELIAATTMPTLFKKNISDDSRPSGVDARKWQQIMHFIAAAFESCQPSVGRWLDWCAGKGHLGTAVHERLGQPVTCLEINRELVTLGNQRMHRAGRAVTFIHADVLTDDVTPWLTPSTGVVALHACGHLNTRLFEQALTTRPAFMAVVPCCYQRIDGMHFSPLSSAGNETGLSFARHQLRLPALDEVKTTSARRQFRRREMAFRQGVDLLLREASGTDEYTPLGKIPPALVRGTFAEFAAYVQRNKHYRLPTGIDWVTAEKNGWERQRLVSVLSVSRQLFRRVLEVWLFYDRISWLEENGYKVHYGTFCPGHVTPRNLMLIAVSSQ